MELRESQENTLPWWTWILPVVLLHLGSQVSALFKFAPGASLYYLPTTMSIVFINWWGPKRILPVVYINAALSAYLWDVELWSHRFLLTIPETIFPMLSWYLFTYRAKGDYTLPDVKSLLNFLLLGLIIPLFVEVGLLGVLFVSTGIREPDTMIAIFARSWLGEFVSNFGLALPALYFLSHKVFTLNRVAPRPIKPSRAHPSKKRIWEIVIVYVCIGILSVTIPFAQYWFVYGIFSLFIAIRFGFGLTVITNAYIFIVTYIIQLVGFTPRPATLGIETDDLNIYLGTSLLYVFSALIGRVISDMEQAELQIKCQLQDLEKANTRLKQTSEELDHFVYSVSHDLSAPLKSILGLVNISKLTSEPETHKSYFEKIEASVLKLNAFIKEVLDYSYNSRSEIHKEAVHLNELIADIITNLSYVDNFDKIHIDYFGLRHRVVQSDKTRIKIILNNLLTNAIKYQRLDPNHRPTITISSAISNGYTVISVEDNGEGIKPELVPKIFNMFFRATERSKGAGLGLYIAKETSRKLGGDLSVESEYGKGSVFKLSIPN